MKNVLDEILNRTQTNFSDLPKECIEKLLSEVTLKSYAKNELLVKDGQHAKTAYFIVEGVARAYYYVSEKDITDWFALENELICPIVSFFSEKASPHYIQVLQNSIVIEIQQDTISQLCKEYHQFETFMRKELTQTMLRQQNRISTILFYTAEQKYLRFMEDYPGLANKIPLKHIASHLGMTLETLSRTRKSLGLI